MSLTLTDAELIALTGFKRQSKQAEWLKREGFKFRLNKVMRPRVDRTHYTERMGGTAASATKTTGPNWAALKGI